MGLFDSIKARHRKAVFIGKINQEFNTIVGGAGSLERHLTHYGLPRQEACWIVDNLAAKHMEGLNPKSDNYDLLMGINASEACSEFYEIFKAVREASS
jgi:hypothetical protein